MTKEVNAGSIVDLIPPISYELAGRSVGTDPPPMCCRLTADSKHGRERAG
jgi:hypothetical protein